MEPRLKNAASPAVQPAAGREEIATDEMREAARDWLRKRWSQDHPNEGHVKQLADYAAHLAAISTPAQASETGGEVQTLRVLLDNLVIAQSLSRELRQLATDQARSYLYQIRQAALSAPQAAPGEGEQS